MTSVRAGLVTRSPHRFAADPSRVITRLFVPGQEGFERQESRTGAVLARILALDEDEVRSSLDDVVTRFDGRHRDLVGTFRRHARELADRLDADRQLSEARMLLLGAAFTSEYAIEGAALCNPSIVAHPDQTGTAAGSLRFVMSVRGIGEGHRSSIGFRTGVVDTAGGVTIDDPAPFASVGAVMPTLLDAAVFRSELARLDDAGEAADYVFDALGDRFTRADLDEQLDKLQTHLSTRGHAAETISLIRTIAERTYGDRIRRRDPAFRACAVAGDGRGGGRHGGCALRAFRRRRRVGHVLCHLHGLQRIPHQPATPRDRRFPVIHLHADGRTCRGQQGPGTVSPPDARTLRGHVEIRPRIEFDCLLRSSVRVDGIGSLPAADSMPGRRYSSGTVARPSKPTPGGWCSPTASARCGPTASGRCCSISRIRHGSSVSSGTRC